MLPADDVQDCGHQSDSLCSETFQIRIAQLLPGRSIQLILLSVRLRSNVSICRCQQLQRQATSKEKELTGAFQQLAVQKQEAAQLQAQV